MGFSQRRRLASGGKFTAEGQSARLVRGQTVRIEVEGKRKSGEKNTHELKKVKTGIIRKDKKGTTNYCGRKRAQ